MQVTVFRNLLLVVIGFWSFFSLAGQKPSRHSLSIGAGATSSAFIQDNIVGNSDTINGAIGIYNYIGFNPAFLVDYDYYLRHNLCIGAFVSGQFISSITENTWSLGRPEKSFSFSFGLTGDVFLWKGLYTGLGVGVGLGVSYQEFEVRPLSESNLAIHKNVNMPTFGEVIYASPLNSNLNDEIFEVLNDTPENILLPMLQSRVTLGYKLPLTRTWAIDFKVFGLLGYRIGGGDRVYYYEPLDGFSGVLVEQTSSFSGPVESITTGQVFDENYKSDGYSVVQNAHLRTTGLVAPEVDLNFGFNLAIACRF